MSLLMVSEISEQGISRHRNRFSVVWIPNVLSFIYIKRGENIHVMLVLNSIISIYFVLFTLHCYSSADFHRIGVGVIKINCVFKNI